VGRNQEAMMSELLLRITAEVLAALAIALATMIVRRVVRPA
jgi:hypothetical protein